MPYKAQINIISYIISYQILYSIKSLSSLFNICAVKYLLNFYYFTIHNVHLYILSKYRVDPSHRQVKFKSNLTHLNLFFIHS